MGPKSEVVTGQGCPLEGTVAPDSARQPKSQQMMELTALDILKSEALKTSVCIRS